MTETTTKSAARRLAEIRHLLRLRPAAELPAALRPEHLAALMAGCLRSDDRKKFNGELGLIADGIRDKLLLATEKSKTITPPPRKIGFVGSWKNAHYGRDPNMFYQPDPVTTRWLEIDRDHCAVWIHAIGETPSEHVRAWLGPAWKEAAPEPARAATGKEKAKPQERRDRLAVAIEAALSALRVKGMPSPTAGDVFDHLAERDETGTIEDSTDEKLTWRTSAGTLSDTSRKALANRLTGIRKKTPA